MHSNHGSVYLERGGGHFWKEGAKSNYNNIDTCIAYMCNLVLCYLFCIDVVEELHRVAFRFVCLFICLFVCLDALASSLAPVDQ